MVCRVPVQGHRKVDQLVALVVRTAELLDFVRIIRECPQIVVYGSLVSVYGISAVIIPGHVLIGLSGEPDAGVKGQFGGIRHIPVTVLIHGNRPVGVRAVRVVGIGVLAVLQPCGTPGTVLICHDHVAFACGHGCYQECDLVHPLHGIRSLLLEVPVFPDHLVTDRFIRSCQVCHLAIRPDAYRLAVFFGCTVIEISGSGTCFPHFIRSIRKDVVPGACTVDRLPVPLHLLGRHSKDGLTGVKGFPIDIHRGFGTVDHFKGSTV